MPNKEELKKKLAAMKPTPSVKSSTRPEDDEAQLLVYDNALREALRKKNPQAYDQYLKTISTTRQARLGQMMDMMSIHQDAAKRSGAFVEPMKKESYSVPVPEGYKDSLDESEMIMVLGEQGYKDFQRIRQKGYAKYLNGTGNVRTDLSRYEPIDLNLEKNITGADGYVGKSTPLQFLRPPVNSLSIMTRK